MDWLSEKRDWPVSRQLWWGHRIPVWSRSAPLNDPLWQNTRLPFLPAVATDQPEQSVAEGLEDRVAAFLTDGPQEGQQTLFCCVAAGQEKLERQLEEAGWLQEEDVLDTWFSSALWPHSTLGWPERTPELEYYYPTSTLITSRDIITLWVARMVLAGLNNMGEVPFREVFIHPKILDGYGEGMSKSKGNGVDPLDVIEKFGADALRFGIAYLTTDTQDVRMPVQFECPHCEALIDQTKKNRQLPRIDCPKCGAAFSTQWAQKPADQALPRGAVVSERFELARNFSNKLWNVSRLALINLDGYLAAPLSDEELAFEDHWILSRLATLTQNITQQLDRYGYAEAARDLYDFAWDEFCSFYAEMAKPRFDDPTSRPVAQRVMAYSLDVLLRLLHPMMPFLTEEVWQLLGNVAPQRGLRTLASPSESLVVAPWPTVDADRQNPQLEKQFAKFQAVLGAIREIRSRQGIAPKDSVQFALQCDAETVELLEPMQRYFQSMAKATGQAWGEQIEPPTTHAKVSLKGMEVYVDLQDFLDIGAEIERNSKQEQKLLELIGAKEKKLNNDNFVKRAPADVVERERQSLVELQGQLQSTREALERLRTAL